MDEIIKRGLTPEEQPYPLPELAIGNIVKLKDDEADDSERASRWGIIVEHVTRSYSGVPIVSLHEYDDLGRLKMGENYIPTYNDVPASEFLLWRIATDDGYETVDPDGFDLYPPCEACGGLQLEKMCPKCNGLGHSLSMERLPERE